MDTQYDFFVIQTAHRTWATHYGASVAPPRGKSSSLIKTLTTLRQQLTQEGVTASHFFQAIFVELQRRKVDLKKVTIHFFKSDKAWEMYRAHVAYTSSMYEDNLPVGNAERISADIATSDQLLTSFGGNIQLVLLQLSPFWWARHQDSYRTYQPLLPPEIQKQVAAAQRILTATYGDR